MKVLVTGVNGQLGHEVMKELQKRGHDALGTGRSPTCANAAADMPYVRMNICDKDEVRSVMAEHRPDAVVHCAAWTATDAAEDAENRPLVYSTNVEGTKHIAGMCGELGCKLLYVSTDYVFDGRGSEPWKPDSGEFAPLNYYGITKLEGERLVHDCAEKFFVVRIQWLFGENGRNFVKTMLDLGKTREAVRVVNDQIGAPTYAFDLARLLADIIESEKYGYYHATNEGGYISKYEFVCEIFRRAGYSARVQPVTTAEYGEPKAVRPLNGRLDKSKLTQSGFAALPDWRDALARYMKNIEY